MKTRAVHSVVLGFLTFVSVALLNTHSATFTVSMENSSFVPQNQTVNVGDTVTWVQNEAFIQHTSTSGQPGAPDGKWASPYLDENDEFSHTFTAAGSYPYY